MRHAPLLHSTKSSFRRSLMQKASEGTTVRPSRVAEASLMTARRKLMGHIAACAVTLGAPLFVGAQLVAKHPRVAFVNPGGPLSDMVGPDPVDRTAGAFVNRLRELGYE